MKLTDISKGAMNFDVSDGLAVVAQTTPVLIPTSVSLLGSALVTKGAAWRRLKGQVKS